jgi:bifunctional non-homologous end joining protein LigD
MTHVPVKRMPATQLVPTGKPVAMPDRLEPMHAELGDKPFTDPDWSWEPKLDGYRVLAFIGEGGVKLRSRRGLDLTASFPRLAAEVGRQSFADEIRRHGNAALRGPAMILDGEIVALGADGKPSFNALQNRVQLKTERELKAADQGAPALFYAFDLLHFAGIDLRGAAYRDRRRYLSQCLLPSKLVQLVHAADDGVALHQAALASGFEGVIAKRKDSRYETGRRSGAWLKVKPTQSAEFVIGGYTKGKGSREALGAILVGYWEGRTLRFASGVGSGFDDRGVAKMLELLKTRERKAMPFAEKPDLPGPMIWVEPELVVEVKFQSWTDDEHLRAPVFMRLRDDVEAKDVKRVRSPRVAAERRIEGRPSISAFGATPGVRIC